MLTVVTHMPSPLLQQCELTFVESAPISIEKAAREHDSYCKMLETCGAKVLRLTGNLSLPDSVFVEDPIIVFDEVAVTASMGVSSRRKEIPVLQAFFSQYRPVEQILLPARIEGGDVLKIGRDIYVGESPRTNKEGIEALACIIEPLGYRVNPVRVWGCLHLKTGCTALDEQTVLINSAWVDRSPFKDYSMITVPPQEPFGANVLPMGGIICMNSAFPETVKLVRSRGYMVAQTDISEFVKAEAGLTCMCVPFREKVDATG